MTDLELKKLKDDLWHSADMLRASAHLAANKYGQPILGLIFLRYADILYKQHKKEIEDRIIIPTLNGMKKENISYKGILTISIILSEDGPVLVDYHVRLNDPATQAMVPIIKTDVLEILMAMEKDTVGSVNLRTTNECTVAVVLAAPGYPMQPETGREIKGIDYSYLMNINDKPLVFVGAVKKTSDGRYFTDGGRNITVVGRGNSLQDANEKAYSLIQRRKLDALWYRDDIGNKFFTWES